MAKTAGEVVNAASKPMMSNRASNRRKKLLVAASGTGGHLFPAIATAQQLIDYDIEWLGVPDRLETQLVPSLYPLHTVRMGGAQGGFGLSSIKLLAQFAKATRQVRQLLKQGKFSGVFNHGRIYLGSGNFSCAITRFTGSYA